MCGRFILTKNSSDLFALFKVSTSAPNLNWTPSYNIAPTQFSPVLRSNDKRTIQIMRWGLLPCLGDNIKTGKKIINARAESIKEKPTFRSLVKSQRCIIFADGYYEWMATSTPAKQPYYIHPFQEQILLFAGLWDSWIDIKKNKWMSYTIITTQASRELRYIHNRMPGIINTEDIDRWIDPKYKIESALDLLQPYSGRLNCTPVSTFVNSYANNELECIKPITLER